MPHSRTAHSALANNNWHLTPLRVALSYGLFATLWILFSDTLLGWLVDDPQLLTRLSLYKGLAFVVTTTLLLYLVLRIWREPTLTAAPQARLPVRQHNYLPLLFLLLLAAVPLIGYSVIHLHGPVMEQEAQQNLQSIVELKARQVENWLNERHGDGLVFTANTMLAERFEEWLNTAEPRFRHNIEVRLDSVRQARGERGYASLFIVDTQGRPRLGADDTAILPEQALLQLERSLASGTMLHTDLYPDHQDVLRMDFIVPLINPAGTAVGAVIMQIEPEQFLFPLIATWQKCGDSCVSLLLRRQGKTLELIHATESIEKTALLEELQTQIYASENFGYFTAMDPHGEPIMAAYAYVDGTPWLLVSQVTRKEILDHLYTLALWITLIVFFAALAISTALLLLWQFQRRLHRLALQAQAAEMGHLLQYFYDSPLIGMTVLSAPERQWLRFNDHLCEMFGHDRQTLQQQHWESLLTPESRLKEQQSLQAILDGETDSYQQELDFLHRDGHPRSMMVNLQAVRTADGRVDFYIATLQDITERREHERALQRQRDLYNMISHTNKSIVRCKSQEQLFHDTCNIAIDNGHFRFARLLQLDKATNKLHTLAACSQEVTPLPVKNVRFHSLDLKDPGPARQFLEQGSATVINHVLGSEVLAPWHELAKTHQVAAMALLPIHRHGEIFGCLALYASDKGFFDAEILATLHEMTMDIGFALENFDRAKALEIANQVVESSPVVLFRWKNQPGWPLEYVSENIRRWGYSAAALLDGKVKYDEMIHADDRERIHMEVEHYARQRINSYQQIYRLYHADGRIIWVEDRTSITRDKDGNPVSYSGVVTDITERQEAEERFRALVEQSLVGIFMLHEDHLHYANPRAEKIHGYAEQETRGMPVAQFIAPEDRPRILAQLAEVFSGEIAKGQLQYRGLCKDGSEIMIGAHVSPATIDGKPMLIGVLQDITDKLRTEQQIQQHMQQLEAAMEGTVHAVSYMVELRDPYTSGHERRVGEIAGAIAAEMGMDEPFQHAIRMIGGLHDVGKITVPAEILSKPGRLTEMEYEIIKAHSQQGYEILKSIQFPWPVAEAVLQHHERMDGSGYPQGLKGEEIILEARIICVADVVESMASHRPYRPGIGIDIALEEIEQGAERLYDPEVAAACLRLFRDRGYQIPA